MNGGRAIGSTHHQLALNSVVQQVIMPEGSAEPSVHKRQFDSKVSTLLVNGLRVFFALMLSLNPISKAFSSIAEVVAFACLLGLLLLKPSRFAVRERWRAQPILLYFLAFYAIQLLGMAYTSDVKEGLWELNMRHYWVVLPLLGTAVEWPKKWLNGLLLFFCAANVYVSACILITLTTGHSIDGSTLHDLSPYVQRPRASLMLAGAVIVAIYLSKQSNALWQKLVLFTALIFLCIGILVLGGRVGQLGLVLVAPIILMLLYPTVFNNNFKKMPYSIST